MSVWNVFDPDAFKLDSLTAAINNLAFTPTYIAQSGLFQELGLPNVTAIVEDLSEVIALVGVKPRNGVGQVVNSDKRKVYPFTIPHLPQWSTIMADSVQGVREFGSEGNAKTVESVRNSHLAKMRRQNDYTIEYHRLQAVQGNYIDVNGDAKSLFTEFGVSQTTVDFALNNSATKVRSKCLSVLTALETALGSVPYTDVEVWCGATFWDNLITHANVEATWLNTQMASALREGLINSLRFGDMTFKRYRGSSAVGLAAKEAYALPLGVESMFLTRFAPANYTETVNTIGLPYYAKAEELKFGKGVEIEVQSNPLNICTRPHAVIKLTTP